MDGGIELRGNQESHLVKKMRKVKISIKERDRGHEVVVVNREWGVHPRWVAELRG